MADAVLRLNQVKARTGLSRSTIYAYITQNLFPTPLKLGPRAVGWLESDIQSWVEEKIVESRGELA